MSPDDGWVIASIGGTVVPTASRLLLAERADDLHPNVLPALQLLGTVRFYGTLTQQGLDMDMDIAEGGLHVVAVGPFLILEMDKAKLGRASMAVETRITVLNAHLDEAVDRQVAAGAQVVQARWDSAPGPGVRLRHPDGLLAEYLEHRPSPDDAVERGLMFR